jgi:disulfide bond formation protein DsbB
MSAISLGRSQCVAYALLMLVGMAAVILTALWLQYFGGYVPCELCLKERIPYYVGIPLVLLAIISSVLKMPVAVTRTLLGLAVISMLVGTGLSIYHAGVEWKFWEGPSSCASSVDSVAKSTTDLLSDLGNQHGPSCTEAAFRVYGISLSGLNVIGTLVLALIGYRAARKA